MLDRLPLETSSTDSQPVGERWHVQLSTPGAQQVCNQQLVFIWVLAEASLDDGHSVTRNVLR